MFNWISETISTCSASAIGLTLFGSSILILNSSGKLMCSSFSGSDLSSINFVSSGISYRPGVGRYVPSLNSRAFVFAYLQCSSLLSITIIVVSSLDTKAFGSHLTLIHL